MRDALDLAVGLTWMLFALVLCSALALLHGDRLAQHLDNAQR